MSAPNHGSKVQPISVPLGALCREEPVFIAGSASGPLSGLRFVAKDVFDVEGRVTGAGNPDWRRTHSPAACTATAIRLLVDAGAELAGMALTEELQFSLTGENPHYGTPRNVKAPGRIPGGSSSGSAAVVGAGLAPFALGADSGGSVRVPAALCGVHGMRPTHGAVPISGCLPLGPSFDTVGWFGVDARTLERVGDVLLSEPAPYERRAPRRLVVLADAFAIAEPSTQVAVRDAAARLALLFEEVEETALAPPGKLESWRAAVRTLPGRGDLDGAWRLGPIRQTNSRSRCSAPFRLGERHRSRGRRQGSEDTRARSSQSGVLAWRAGYDRRASHRPGASHSLRLQPGNHRGVPGRNVRALLLRRARRLAATHDSPARGGRSAAGSVYHRRARRRPNVDGGRAALRGRNDPCRLKSIARTSSVK